MITDIEAKRLVIISDLHLGNPFCKTKQRTIEFLYWAARNGYDICINGDGFEIAQASFTKIAKDVPDVFHALKFATEHKCNVYYVVGNHDILLENFLNDWGGFKVAPFLNLWSGGSRIRIEHGHLYDPFFVKHPDLYEFATWLAGFVLMIAPRFYKLWMAIEKVRSLFWKAPKGAILGEHPSFVTAAQELADRGFDYVIFGHTHHVGQVQLEGQKLYLNPGSWLLGTSYVEIVDGYVSLRNWSPTLSRATSQTG